MNAPDYGYTDDGDRVPIVQPVYPNEEADPAADEEARLRREIIARVIQWLASGRVGPRVIGRRVLILKHAISPEGTQQELAARLHVSPARVSQALAAWREGLNSGT